MRHPLPCLSLALIFAATSVALAQEGDEELILGRPSAIRAPSEARETVELAAGTRLYEQPTIDSPVFEILQTPVALPVLDRYGPWVQVVFGQRRGWIHTVHDSPADVPNLPLAVEPDDRRLHRARSLLGAEIEPTELGPFTLYTDLEDRALLGWLSATAADIHHAYRSRFGLDPGEVGSEVLVIFAREADYRHFEGAEDRVARADSRGYTTEGLSVLFAGDHDRTSLASVFIHELTHLLNRRVFRATLPPWLEEGLAEDLAFCQVTRQGTIRLGTLAGSARQGPADRYALTEPRAHLSALVDSWTGGAEPDLAALTVMDWQEFIRPDRRARHYAASAMLLRTLLDGGDPDLRQRFHDYLAGLVSAEMPDSDSLWQALERAPGEIEEAVFRFALLQARIHGLR